MIFTVSLFCHSLSLRQALVALCVVRNVFGVSVQTEIPQLLQQIRAFEMKRENLYVYYKTWVHAVKGSITVAGN